MLWHAPWFRWAGCEQVDQCPHGRDGHAPFSCGFKVSFQRDNGITDSMLTCGSEIMACRDWRSMVLSGLQGHRTDQPGRNEGLVFGFFVLGDVCPSAALLRRELRIADQAVWPAIDDFDL